MSLPACFPGPCLHGCPCRPPSTGPSGTTYMTLRARDVRKGDFLDTRDPGVGNTGYLALVFAPPVLSGRGSGAACTLHVTGHAPFKCSASTRVSVWRLSTKCEDARPIDLRTDRPVRNLTETHRAGKEGLAEMFPLGSFWEVGPFSEGQDPQVVQITGDPWTSGVNYSSRPEDAEARGKPTWFVRCTTVWSSYAEKLRDIGGEPPHVLCALTPRMAAKAGIACCACATYVEPCRERILSCNAGVIQSMRAEADTLRRTIDEQRAELNEANARYAASKARADAAERRLASVRAAVA